MELFSCYHTGMHLSASKFEEHSVGSAIGVSPCPTRGAGPPRAGGCCSAGITSRCSWLQLLRSMRDSTAERTTSSCKHTLRSEEREDECIL